MGPRPRAPSPLARTRCKSPLCPPRPARRRRLAPSRVYPVQLESVLPRSLVRAHCTPPHEASAPQSPLKEREPSLILAACLARARNTWSEEASRVEPPSLLLRQPGAACCRGDLSRRHIGE